MLPDAGHIALESAQAPGGIHLIPPQRDDRPRARALRTAGRSAARDRTASAPPTRTPTTITTSSARPASASPMPDARPSHAAAIATTSDRAQRHRRRRLAQPRAGQRGVEQLRLDGDIGQRPDRRAPHHRRRLGHQQHALALDQPLQPLAAAGLDRRPHLAHRHDRQIGSPAEPHAPRTIDRNRPGALSRQSQAQRRHVALGRSDALRNAAHDTVRLRGSHRVTDGRRARAGGGRRGSGLGDEDDVAGAGDRLRQQRVARRSSAAGDARAPQHDIDPDRDGAGPSHRRHEPRQHRSIPRPDAEALLARRIPRHDDDRRTHGSQRRHPGIPHRGIDAGHTLRSSPTRRATVTIVVASPITTAIGPRPRRRARI